MSNYLHVFIYSPAHSGDAETEEGHEASHVDWPGDLDGGHDRLLEDAAHDAPEGDDAVVHAPVGQHGDSDVLGEGTWREKLSHATLHANFH